MTPVKQEILSWLRAKDGPAWRSMAAESMATSPTYWRTVDGYTNELARYLRLAASRGDRGATARRVFPEMARAEAIQRDPRQSDALRVMVLGNLPESEILSRSQLSRADACLWRKLYFDVDFAKDSMSWIMSQIVCRELSAGNARLASHLHMARYRGPEVARRLLDGPPLPPEDPDAYRRWLILQTQIEALPYLLQGPQCREEMESLVKLSLTLQAQEEQAQLTRRKLDGQDADRTWRREQAEARRQQPQQPLAASDTARSSTTKRKFAAAAKKAKQRRIQLRVHALKQQDWLERQARIAASPLSRLAWAKTSQSAVLNVIPQSQPESPLEQDIVAAATQLPTVPQGACHPRPTANELSPEDPPRKLRVSDSLSV